LTSSWARENLRAMSRSVNRKVKSMCDRAAASLVACAEILV